MGLEYDYQQRNTKNDLVKKHIPSMREMKLKKVENWKVEMES